MGRPAIRAVFFDAVGTILLPAESVAATYRRVALAQGLDVPEALIRSRILTAFVRQEEIDSVAGWRTDERRELDRWRAIVTETLCEAEVPEKCFEELWNHYSHPAAWRVDPDLSELLERLRNAVTLGIASNFDGRLPGIIDQLPVLEALRSAVVVSSLTGWRKPARQFFDDVIRAAGCRPEEILFVGDDRRNDFVGATEAGMQAVLIDPERKHNVAGSISRLKEVHDVLEAWPAS